MIYVYNMEDQKQQKIEVRPGFEPGTFCVLSRCDNHYTTEPTSKVRLVSPKIAGADKSFSIYLWMSTSTLDRILGNYSRLQDWLTIQL